LAPVLADDPLGEGEPNAVAPGSGCIFTPEEGLEDAFPVGRKNADALVNELYFMELPSAPSSTFTWWSAGEFARISIRL
jgi:hypothetical protein